MSDRIDEPKTPVGIPGWPVAAPGLLMTTIDNVVFMHLNDRMSDATYALYLHALEASLTHRPTGARVAVVYDVPTLSGLRAMSARAAGDVMRRHRDTLCETTACFALVSPSSLARAAAQTVLAVSRLPFPQRTLPTLRAALVFAAAILPEIDPGRVERRIEEQLLTHQQAMRR